jgi:GNAT superfamily N-acetyltransferase
MLGMVTVRLAGVDDAEAITRVHIRGWQWGYAGLMPAPYLAALDQTEARRVEQRREHLANLPERSSVLVAVRATEVVGFANVGRYRDKQDGGDLADTVGEVYAIYVTPEVAGGGVGRAIMDAAVAWAHGQGLDPVRLWVLEENARARAFYERYGFRLDGGRSTYTLEQPGELPVDLAEVRYTLAARVGG